MKYAEHIEKPDADMLPRKKQEFFDNRSMYFEELASRLDDYEFEIDKYTKQGFTEAGIDASGLAQQIELVNKQTMMKKRTFYRLAEEYDNLSQDLNNKVRAEMEAKEETKRIANNKTRIKEVTKMLSECSTPQAIAVLLVSKGIL